MIAKVYPLKGLKNEDDFNEVARHLLVDVANAVERFKAINEEKWSAKPDKNKWSKKEVLGHLVDSASNNHQRFVRAQLEEKELFSPGYQQELFVSAQNYQLRKASEIIELWQAYNKHIAHVIRHVDRAKSNILCTIGNYEPVTLSFMMKDYVGHLEHHLAQIFDESR